MSNKMDKPASPKPRMLKYYISPSGFASFFHFNCQRQLVFSTAHVERSRWFYRSTPQDSWLSFDQASTYALEVSHLSNEVCHLFDGSQVNLPKRVHTYKSENKEVLRSNWFYDPTSASGEAKESWQPLSEKSCAELEKSFYTPNQPTEIEENGVHYAVNINDMNLSQRFIGKEPPQDVKPLRLMKSRKSENEEKDLVSTAFTSSGDNWETQILHQLSAGNDSVYIGEPKYGAEERDSDKKISFLKFLEILKLKSKDLSSSPDSSVSNSTSTSKREWIYQPSLESPKELYERLGLNKSQVVFRTCFPDFLELVRSPDGQFLEILIVDAKATDHMKLSHRIQVGIYYFILDSILDANNLKSSKIRVSTTGGVWLRGKNTYETFDLVPIVNYLSDFFTQGLWKEVTLKKLLEISPQMSSKCSHCTFVPFCKSEAMNQETELSMIYGITSYDKTFLRNFLEQEEFLSPKDILPIELAHTLLSKHERPSLPFTLDSTDEVLVHTPKYSRSKSVLDGGMATPFSTPTKRAASDLNNFSSVAPTSSKTDTSVSSQDITSLSSQNDTQSTATTAGEEFQSTPLISREPSLNQLMPSTPQTPTSSSNYLVNPDFTPTRPVEPPSPFTVALKMPENRPLNRKLWISLMKLRSFLNNAPLPLNQPTSLIAPEEDLPITLTLTSDRPNGHLCAWNILTHAASSSTFKSLKVLASLVKLLEIPSTEVIERNGNIQLVASMSSIVPASDEKVSELETALIKVLYTVMDYSAHELPKKSTTKIYMFTESEASQLEELLLSRAVVQPHLSFGVETNSKIIPNEAEMASKLIRSIFTSPELIGIANQPYITRVTPPVLVVLKNHISALIALPLKFDADFDDFFYALCPVTDPSSLLADLSLDLSSFNLGQKGILGAWYKLVSSKVETRSTYDAISKLKDIFFQRGQKLMLMVDSIRKILSTSFTDIEGPRMDIQGVQGPKNLICGKSKHFDWQTAIPSFHPILSKLHYLNNYDLYSSSRKKMINRETIAYGDVHQLEEKIAALRFVSTVEGFTRVQKRPKVFHKFEFDYMSESMISSIHQDILNDTAVTRWILAENSSFGISAALSFNDLAHANSGPFKFSPPKSLAFATPKELQLNPNGTSFVVFEVKCGKEMKQPVPNAFFYISEFEVDLTSDILTKVLTSLDMRIGFQHHLACLTAIQQTDLETKKIINEFLVWFKASVEAASDLDPKKLGDYTFNLDPKLAIFFESMGGYQGFFLETKNSVALESLPVLGLDNSQKPTLPMIKLKFMAHAIKWGTVAKDLLWAIEEFMGTCIIGTKVTIQLLETPLTWGTAVPSDWKDQTDDILRVNALANKRRSLGVLTAAQYEVIETVLKQKLMCVWGPPGTGKTYFLSNMILLFLEGHRRFRTQVVRESMVKVKTVTKSAKKTRAKKTESLVSEDPSSSKDTPSSSNTSTTNDNTPVPSHVTPKEAVSSNIEEEISNLTEELKIDLNIDSKSKEPTIMEKTSTPGHSSTPVKKQEEEKEVWIEETVPTGSEFKIVIVAFTHSAIDNLLLRFMQEDVKYRSELSKEAKLPDQTSKKSAESTNVAAQHRLPVGRLLSDKSSSVFFRDNRFAPEDVPTLLSTSKDLETFLELNPQCVVGCTVWSLRKYASLCTPFNMVVIDEASQILLSQAVIPTQYLMTSGRLVVAGDHHQLPPILDTVFPDNLHIADSVKYAKSMFEYLKISDPDFKITKMLYENWRSCEALSIVPATTIYALKNNERKYHPANDTIANQEFWLKPTENLPKNLKPAEPHPITFNWVQKPEAVPITIAYPLLQLMFDATRPLGVILLKQSEHGVSLDSFPQARLIALLASATRQASLFLNPGQSDGEFWKSKLLVVAPHHVQKTKIRTHLAEKRYKSHYKWNTDVTPAIETVEKAQGRQFTSVIMDYGIIDHYRVSKEMSFLYSRNRINVAQTRAESKCLMIVSDVMLQMQPSVYSSQAIQDGFAYLQYFVEWARKNQLVTEVYAHEMEHICDEMEKDPFFSYFKN